jgi:hypothetical protein
LELGVEWPVPAPAFELIVFGVSGVEWPVLALALELIVFGVGGVEWPVPAPAFAPDSKTGLLMVEPSSINNHVHFAVIHIDSIFQSAHLIPVYGPEMLPAAIKFHHTLDIFTLFYVNKYADHHAFEIAY